MLFPGDEKADVTGRHAEEIRERDGMV